MEAFTDLIRGCIDMNPRCQKIIYEQYRGFAFKMAFRYIYGYDKAADVVNDSFVKVFNKFDTFQFQGSDDNEKIFLGWLRRIVINTAIDQLRREQMLPEIGGIPESAFETADSQFSADKISLYNDLMTIVKRLPPHYRIVFNLYVIDGYSHAEIADMMDTTIGTSKSQLSRARAILQNELRKMEEKDYAGSR